MPPLSTEPLPQHLLAEVGALAAVGLCLAEEVRQLTVALPLRVLDVGLQPQRVVQALFGEPNEVVILVGRSGDMTGLASSHRFPPFLWPRDRAPDCPRSLAAFRAWPAPAMAGFAVFRARVVPGALPLPARIKWRPRAHNGR